jgi:hypothetical protein
VTPEVAECNAAAKHERIGVSDRDLVPGLQRGDVTDLLVADSAALGDVLMC